MCPAEFGIIIVVIIVAAYLVLTHSDVERYEMGIIGNGLRGDRPYTSGADLRFATEFTSTDQQPYSTPRDADVKAIAAALAANGDPVSGAAVRTAMSGGRERMESEPAHMYMCPCTKCKVREHYDNRPPATTVSGCSQGTPCLNRGVSDAAVSGLVRTEHLVGLGQSPVFWEISPELGKYRNDDRDDYFGLGN